MSAKRPLDPIAPGENPAVSKVKLPKSRTELMRRGTMHN